MTFSTVSQPEAAGRRSKVTERALLLVLCSLLVAATVGLCLVCESKGFIYFDLCVVSLKEELKHIRLISSAKHKFYFSAIDNSTTRKQLAVIHAKVKSLGEALDFILYIYYF